METRYRELLDSKGRALIDRIESYGSAEIGIEQCDEGPACVVSEEEATICFPNLDSISPEAFVHELLHIERNWPERVPQLFSNVEEPRRIQAIGTIDNDIEHLVIGPKIADYGFDPHDHWNRKIAEKWRMRFWERTQGAQDLRANLLLGYLTAQFLVSDESIKEGTDDVLRANGFLAEGLQFVSEMRGALASKEQMVSIAVHYLGMPLDSVRLDLFDIQQRHRIMTQIPQWNPHGQ